MQTMINYRLNSIYVCDGVHVEKRVSSKIRCFELTTDLCVKILQESFAHVS